MSPMQIIEKLKARRQNSVRSVMLCSLLCASCTVALQAQFTYEDLYDFNCSTGGCQPINRGSLTQDSNGNLIGTASSNPAASGALFYLNTSSPAAYAEYVDFSSPAGIVPESGATLGWDGNFYLTTNEGGEYGYGTVFIYFNGKNAAASLHHFTSAEGPGLSPPVAGKDGNLYGVTGSGLAYTILITNINAFYGLLGGNASGHSAGPLLLASDGNLYGATYNGGTNNQGSIFRMTTPSGAIKTVYSFTGTSGYLPSGALVEGSDGYLYGTAEEGGKNNTGVIFKVKTTGSGFKVLFNFDADTGGFCNKFGENPVAGLTIGTDGNFYGVTGAGGANCQGTIFQMLPNGTVTKLFDFTGSTGSVMGSRAQTALQLATDGNFYGLTESGGANGDGVYFRLAPLNLIQILTVVGPIFVTPGLPVEILGNNLSHVAQLTFGNVQAQFQAGTDSYLTATVPTGAIDAPITATLDTGLQISTQGSVHILPTITSLDPLSGPVGTLVDISGGGFAGATKVTFGGVKATSFSVLSPSLIQATVPAGAKKGQVAVTTPNSRATSTQKFTVN